MWWSNAAYLAVIFFHCYLLGGSDGSENSDLQRAASGPIVSKNNCQYKYYPSMYFYGPVIKIQRNVTDVDKCIALCWKFVIGGARRCQAVNYVKTDKRCEMMHQEFDVTNRVLVKYYGDRNPNAAYCVPISCTEPPKPSPEANCGKTEIDPMGKGRATNRIIGGTESIPHSVPWIVSLRQGFSGKRHFCGGTLIRVNDGNETDIVITAAHCNEDGLESDMVDVVVGAHDLKQPAAEEQTVEYEDGMWISHEEYDHKTMDNDIAIMKLKTPIKFGKSAQPACLPQPGERLPDGTLGLVAGWGNTEEGSKQAQKLQQLVVPIVNTEKCAGYYKKVDKVITDKIMMCAGYPEGGKDSCQGDSGGPLTFKSAKGSYVLQGVVSFGKGCARAEMPGIYARVSTYIDWINDKVKKLSTLANKN